MDGALEALSCWWLCAAVGGLSFFGSGPRSVFFRGTVIRPFLLVVVGFLLGPRPGACFFVYLSTVLSVMHDHRRDGGYEVKPLFDGDHHNTVQFW